MRHYELDSSWQAPITDLKDQNMDTKGSCIWGAFETPCQPAVTCLVLKCRFYWRQPLEIHIGKTQEQHIYWPVGLPLANFLPLQPLTLDDTHLHTFTASPSSFLSQLVLPVPPLTPWGLVQCQLVCHHTWNLAAKWHLQVSSPESYAVNPLVQRGKG